MIEAKNGIEVLEIYGITEQGATAPIRVGLSDGTMAIAKYPNNACGNQILVNEWVCSCIAERINLCIPKFGICNLSKDVIEAMGSEAELDERNSGRCFYTSYIANSIPLTNGTLLSLGLDGFKLERLILFDHIIGNHERHRGNLLVDMGKGIKLYAIDHGTIFTNSVRYELDDLLKQLDKRMLKDASILKDNSESYDLLFHIKNLDQLEMEHEVEHIKHVLTAGFLNEIKKSIPDEWINLAESDTIDRLLDAIEYRATYLDEICEMIISERRNS